MLQEYSTAQAVRTHLRHIAPNTVFTPAEIIAQRIGSPSAVRKALTRFVRAGEIQRIRKGYYLRLHIRAHIPGPSFSPQAIAEAYARKTAFRKAKKILL